jgi:hypothetical protein
MYPNIPTQELIKIIKEMCTQQALDEKTRAFENYADYLRTKLHRISKQMLHPMQRTGHGRPHQQYYLKFTFKTLNAIKSLKY